MQLSSNGTTVTIAAYMPVKALSNDWQLLLVSQLEVHCRLYLLQRATVHIYSVLSTAL
jgi:hypothetical protein